MPNFRRKLDFKVEKPLLFLKKIKINEINVRDFKLLSPLLDVC